MSIARFKIRDNQQIALSEYRRIDRIRSCVRLAVEARDEYVGSRQLDKAFCLPDGNWSSSSRNDYIFAYQHIRDGGPDVVGRLKFFAQVFSGFNAMTLEPGHGLPSVREVPPDLDDWIDANRDGAGLIPVWEAITRDVPERFIMSPPPKCGEHGWLAGDRIVNHDALAYQERISLLYDAGILDRLRQPRILEIGGGYGALARALTGMLDASEYVICDLPESLMFSGTYLAATTRSAVEMWPSAGLFTLVPNYRVHELSSTEKFDLVINTISMSEMTPHQVNVYCGIIARRLGRDGVFFEQNTEGSGPETARVSQITARHFRHSQMIKTMRPVSQGAPMLHWN